MIKTSLNVFVMFHHVSSTDSKGVLGIADLQVSTIDSLLHRQLQFIRP